jgi:hypothetical protein
MVGSHNTFKPYAPAVAAVAFAAAAVTAAAAVSFRNYFATLLQLAMPGSCCMSVPGATTTTNTTAAATACI